MIGRTISHYEVVEKLGEGGMGVVYRARDSHLDRFIALKVLPPDKVADPERKQRFVNEAKTASALNHPNIVTVYDIDQAGGVDFIAMEFVQGKTLDEVIGRKGLKLNEALKYAIQIADALAKAHAAGIVHRDLKPANVMVTGDGSIKVLDFGLAKLTESAVLPDSETRTERQSTEVGAIVGTASYMSPEQAAGKKVDARSDIFSFGSLLYEMLTGRRAFRRDTPALTLAAILHMEPPLLGPAIPRDLEKIVMHCLRKDPARRYQYMADVKVALEDLKEESESGALEGAAASEQKRSRRWLWIPAMMAALLLAAILVWRLRVASPPGELQPVPLTAYGGSTGGPSFDRDGNRVAFSWDGPNHGNAYIYVKQISSAAPPRRLTDSTMPENAPAWSPDGNWIAFMRKQQGNTALIVVPSEAGPGGPERNIRELIEVEGLSWTPDSKWLVVGGRDSENMPTRAILAFNIDTKERRTLAEGSSAANPSISANWTLAFRLQPEVVMVYGLYTLQLTPDLKPAGKQVRVVSQNYTTIGGIAWTGDGREIIYSAGISSVLLNLWRVPASGGQPPKRVPVEPIALAPAIAPKARRLAYVRRDYSRNFWRLDTRTGELKKLIDSRFSNMIPQYSPDGSKIAFGSNRMGSDEIWTCDADGSNCQQLTRIGGMMVGTPRWSPDGKSLVFDSRAVGQSEIYVIAADGGAPKRMTFHPMTDSRPSYSQDGLWIYFDSARRGRWEIWKIPAEGGEEVQVTRSGGAGAVESPDGKSLYYVKDLGARMPVGLFKMPVEGGEETQVLPLLPGTGYQYFAVSKKGIYFITSDRKKIQFLNEDTGRVTPVVSPEKPAWDLCVSPDGAYILWSQEDRDTTDLMLVENFR